MRFLTIGSRSDSQHRQSLGLGVDQTQRNQAIDEIDIQEAGARLEDIESQANDLTTACSQARARPQGQSDANSPLFQLSRLNQNLGIFSRFVAVKAQSCGIELEREAEAFSPPRADSSPGMLIDRRPYRITQPVYCPPRHTLAWG